MNGDRVCETEGTLLAFRGLVGPNVAVPQEYCVKCITVNLLLKNNVDSLKFDKIESIRKTWLCRIPLWEKLTDLRPC